ncbi:acyl-CoA dehydrogenase family protein [Glaciibacter psychrotolerans]|uniref:Alkylation response protein AidB-like acyl-CoA dehydrogenase n=1 Tax=Glaciibacter psychrotolerans TaxID=670054 RepID=A0A7Z0EF12_9MICO|nr:acyl-CoA dehydrogenase family protein [Leifsonia psychrotolerans]NYJ20463.1 alkylation response protein AidB-like acyl-CoA dehydrogenase [Leifsonia psychrotolerans]
MQFELSDEQRELAEFIRELLSSKSDSASVRATIAHDAPFDAELWSVLCDQIGAASLAIPEEYGGAGYSTFETHIVLEELGYALTPSPYFGSVALAAQAVLASGNAEACARLLPSVADGSRIAALAWADPTGRWSPADVGVSAQETDGVWRLSGETPLVIDGIAADLVLVIAATPRGPALFELTDTGALTKESTPALDPALSFATYRFDASAATLLACEADTPFLDRLRDLALTALTAIQVGAAARGLDMTVAYSLQRAQFGRLIGSYQALKHRMADLHVRLETARTTSRAAAWAAANDSAELGQLASLAKTWCSDSLTAIASETIQLHGGIAITWEHDAHLVFKRAHATAQLFGSPGEQRARVAQSLGLDRTSA